MKFICLCSLKTFQQLVCLFHVCVCVSGLRSVNSTHSQSAYKEWRKRERGKERVRNKCEGGGILFACLIQRISQQCSVQTEISRCLKRKGSPCGGRQCPLVAHLGFACGSLSQHRREEDAGTVCCIPQDTNPLLSQG